MVITRQRIEREALIELIYESAFITDLWSRVLDQLADIADARGGLTPREARVAHGLARGATLDDLAAEGGASRNTVRSQLRAVLEKTGCGRQAEVAILIALPMGRKDAAVSA